MASFPPLPPIEGDYEIMLEIYTHESARNPADPPSLEYGSIDRLTALGRKAAEMAVYYHYFSTGTSASGTSGESILTLQEVAIRSESALHQTTVAGWMDRYNLRGKIRCYPHDQRDDNEIVCNVFYTYVGALYIRNGHASVQAWISALVDPDHPPPAIVESHQSPPQSPPQPNGPPPPMTHPQPPPPLPVPMGQIQSQPGNLDHLITLQVVNQTAQQKGYNVTYPAQGEGPPHAPLWTVQCCMNGNQMGVAQARSQKMAKEEAARMAYKSMGWG